jgi:hypothetical protein
MSQPSAASLVEARRQRAFTAPVRRRRRRSQRRPQDRGAGRPTCDAETVAPVQVPVLPDVVVTPAAACP